MLEALTAFIDRGITSQTVIFLAIDMIRQTRSKSYHSTLHTTKHMRSGQWFPKILDRTGWEGWIEKNGKDLLLTARERREKIMAEHEPEPLDTTLERKIDALVKEYLH